MQVVSLLEEKENKQKKKKKKKKKKSSSENCPENQMVTCFCETEQLWFRKPKDPKQL